ncbi:MAG: hypothetical protein ACLQIB_03900 [Isosphaeraceae bacterium]
MSQVGRVPVVRRGARPVPPAATNVAPASPEARARTPGDDAAAKIVAELSAGHPGKVIIPIA